MLIRTVCYRLGETFARSILIGVKSPPLLAMLAAVLITVERVQRFYLCTSLRLRQLTLATKGRVYTNFGETCVATILPSR